MRAAYIITLAIALVGCDFSSLLDSVDLPTRFSVASGKKVDIGGEIVAIVGSEQCSTGFGDTYACWTFSIKPGDTQVVYLSNGIREPWTTTSEGGERVSLVRPNGFKVVGM